MTNGSKRLFPILIAIIVLQLAVSAYQIIRHETALTKGTLYRFKVRFFDPGDPLQGRYIQLEYDIDYPKDVIIHPESRYGVIKQDESGFVTFSEIRLTPPDETSDYLEIYLKYGDPRIYCDRYYLEESIAPEAEKYFFRKLADSKADVWVDMRVYKGRGIIETIRVDGVPLLDAMNHANSK